MLSENQLINIAQMVVKQNKHAGVTCEVKPSNTTDSLYLVLRLEDIRVQVRFSDHKNSRYDGKVVLLGDKPNIDKVKNSINNSCKQLKEIHCKKAWAKAKI